MICSSISTADANTFRRYFFVGDGCETLSAFETEGEAITEARRLNQENDTTEFNAYSRTVDECDSGELYLIEQI
jgi:hypothetical protein